MMEWLTDILKKAKDDKFTGSIQINFFSGGVTNINKSESIKPPNNWKTEIVVKLLKQQ